MLLREGTEKQMLTGARPAFLATQELWLVKTSNPFRFSFYSGGGRLWQTAVPSFRPDRVYVGDVEEDRRSRLCKTESLPTSFP